jgi:hypothetical protein
MTKTPKRTKRAVSVKAKTAVAPAAAEVATPVEIAAPAPAVEPAPVEPAPAPIAEPAPVAAVAEDTATPEPELPDDCYIRLPKFVNRERAMLWARSAQWRLFGTPIELVGRDGKVIERYDNSNREETAEWCPSGYPWHPNWYGHDPLKPATERKPPAVVNGTAPRRRVPPADIRPRDPTKKTVTVTGVERNSKHSVSDRVVQLLTRPEGASAEELAGLAKWSITRSYLLRVAHANRKKLEGDGKHFKFV